MFTHCGGTVYLDTPDGSKKILDAESFYMDFEPAETELRKDMSITRNMSQEITFTQRAYINRNAILSIIYGRNVTNNWLKTHGGIMTRTTLQQRRDRKRYGIKNRKRHHASISRRHH